MTFLSAGLLAGLVAATIPFALHLLARQQPKRVVFPATRFLQASLHTHRDRLKIRRWWLLALRVLAVAMLALALARPQIHAVTSEAWFVIAAIAATGLGLLVLATVSVARGQAKALRYGLAIAGLGAILLSLVYAGVTMARSPTAIANESSPAAVAIVLDNSIRTARMLPSGTESETGDDGFDSSSATVLNAMRSAAKWFVDEQTNDSLIAIIDRSPRPATFSIDRSAAKNRIEKTQASTQTLPLFERVRAAVSLVRSSELQRKSVLVITDLTAASFDEQHWSTAGLQALLEEEPAVLLQILDVGKESINNLSLGQLEIADATPPRLAKTDLAVVVNTGQAMDVSGRAINVQLELYDSTSDAAIGLPIVRDSSVVLPPLKSVDRATVSSAGNATKVLLSVPPLETGTHHGIVRLMADDELEVDNVRYLTLVVSAPRKLLIVAANRDEANIIAGAITAPFAVDDPLAEYLVEVSEFLPSDRDVLKNCHAVVLLDPTSPTPPMRSDLEAYLSGGGHILSMLGPAIVKDESSADSFPSGLVRSWRVPTPGSFFEITRPAHSSVNSLQSIAGGVPWNAFRVFQYWQMRPLETDIVIARYAGTDHPAILERTVAIEANPSLNVGTHLICTTPMPALEGPARKWNELFSASDAWPAFLLIRDMVDSLVYRDRSEQNLLVGQSARVFLGDVENEGESTEGSRRVQLFVPSEPPVPLAAKDSFVTIDQVSSPGTYWLKSVGMIGGVSVNLQESETDLSRVDSAKFDQWLGEDNYVLVRSRDEIREAEGRGQPTRSLYSAVMLLVLAAFVLEQILSNRFYASRADSIKPAVAA